MKKFSSNPSLKEPVHNLIRDAKLTEVELENFKFKKTGVPGFYHSTALNLLRLHDKGRIGQYRHNRSLPWDEKNNCLRLRASNITRIKRAFDPKALGVFGFIFPIGSGRDLEQATAHHRFEVLRQLRTEGKDLSGITILVQIVDKDSQVLLYSREGEQWAQAMGQRVTNPDLLYGHYYDKLLRETKALGVTATHIPKAQLSQVIEALLQGQGDMLCPLRFGEIWNLRHTVISDANTIWADAEEKGWVLTQDEEFRVRDAAVYIAGVWNAFKLLPLAVDSIKGLTSLPMFKGLILASRTGLSHSIRTNDKGKRHWVALPPVRLAVRMSANAVELRRLAKKISSGQLGEQTEALEDINRILNKYIHAEKDLAKKMEESGK